MADNRSRNRRGRVLRYIAGGVLCLLAAVATAVGLQWYWVVMNVCVAYVVLFNRRKIFRPGVHRTPTGIECRYIPWFESSAYFLNVGLPSMGVAAVAASFAQGNPSWIRIAGVVLLAITPLGTFAALRMWRRCILCFDPAALRLRTADRGDVLTDITRHQLQSVTPKIVSNTVNGAKSLQVEITFGTDASTTRTVLLGLQLTVEPRYLLDALLAWQGATAGDDPTELMDRIERILRHGVTPDELAQQTG